MSCGGKNKNAAEGREGAPDTSTAGTSGNHACQKSFKHDWSFEQVSCSARASDVVKGAR